MTLTRILQLPTYLANQIAAGEVIERPASIVKELLENSLDAGATEIHIAIFEGGMDGILIKDNGCGIHPDDLLLALSAHATSKIAKSEDLENIMTMGFRGEALASISAVSELTLTSRQMHHSHAWQVKAQGRECSPGLQPAAHPIGTSVQVQKLFFNTPARRKFLRSARTEWQYTEEIIHRILLSHFDVEFTLYHNDKKIAHYPKAKPAQRIAKIFSKEFIAVAHEVNADASALQLTGFVAPSEFTRSSHDWQYFYINNRMVRDKLVQHAMRQAFAESLYPGRYAAYALYLTLDPKEVDVNVHPTKHEVRFVQTRLVHDFIVKSVQDVLQQQTLTHAARKTISAHSSPTSLFETTRKTGEFLTVFHDQFILSKTEEGLGLIDLHAYYAYQAEHILKQDKIIKQPLLSIHTFKVTPFQTSKIIAHKAELSHLGFTIDPIGENTWILREIPAVLSFAQPQQLWQILMDNNPQEWVMQLACSFRTGINLAIAEIEQILTTVSDLPEGCCCPHGLIIWQLWSINEIRSLKSIRYKLSPHPPSGHLLPEGEGIELPGAL